MFSEGGTYFSSCSVGLWDQLQCGFVRSDQFVQISINLEKWAGFVHSQQCVSHCLLLNSVLHTFSAHLALQIQDWIENGCKSSCGKQAESQGLAEPLWRAGGECWVNMTGTSQWCRRCIKSLGSGCCRHIWNGSLALGNTRVSHQRSLMGRVFSDLS